MNRRNFKGVLLLLLAAFIWGTAFVAQSMGNSVGPFTFNAVRSFVGFLFLIPVILVISRKRKKLGVNDGTAANKKYIVGGLVCGLALFGGSSLQQVGLQYTTAGKAGFLTALYIVIVPILGIFLKKSAGLKVWLCVAIAALGTYMLSVKEGFSIEPGDLYVIFGAVIFSVHIMVIDYYSAKTDAIRLSAGQFLTSAVLCTVISLIFEQPTLAGIGVVWGPILYAGVLSSGVAYTLQIVGQKETPPAVASLILSLESVFAVLAGWVMLGEQLAPKEMLGCGLVFAAVILAQLPILERKGQKKTKEKLPL